MTFLNSLNVSRFVFLTRPHNNHSILYVKSQPICGPLGPNFDGFCANNTTKTKSGTYDSHFLTEMQNILATNLGGQVLS